MDGRLDGIELDDDDDEVDSGEVEEEGKRKPAAIILDKSPVMPLPIDTSNYPATQLSTSILRLQHADSMAICSLQPMQTNKRRIACPGSGRKTKSKLKNKRSKSKPPAKTAGSHPPPMALSAAIFIENRLLALPTPRPGVYALRVLRGPPIIIQTSNRQWSRTTPSSDCSISSP
ncbi:uncharacterized protein P174DRAFT_446409 [Aspergillus novofumigatus IBT 16806]|uniref:Uncharacterized protein n=1 Tax=Aspergillus novofumigatus (strain IBT 16806) TaxID=1392255 RepID=A0A2I1BT38_ASPN1|nr:uncharacterized protein P174DRAFT_446409 [Aspergillus novofumigatus IBT 16806]PKX88560.1 hypothetical protein P174DRAFT_446409 [Aspergillus novofumigatus IBT 16806]